MSASTMDQLAANVATAITAAAIAPAITDAPAVSAVTAYVAEYDVKDLAQAKITVVPSQLTSELTSRDSDLIALVVDVGIHRKIDRDADVGAMMHVAEQVFDLLRGAPMQVGDLRLGLPTSVQIDPLYSQEMLREKRVFLSVVRATYPAVAIKP